MTKYELLKAMNTIANALNNEEAYWEWADTIPDGATEQDLKYIANDSKYMNEVCNDFKILLDTYAKDGYYVDDDVIG